MRNRLDQIESRLRGLIESSSYLLPWSRREHLLARRLVEALQSSIQSTDTGVLSAAGIYTIFMHPDNLVEWQKKQEVFDALANALRDAAEAVEIRFTSPPGFRLAEDPKLGMEEVAVIASGQVEQSGVTASLSLPIDRKTPESIHNHSLNAFLIVNGTDNFPLRQPVINIGRRSDNNLVLADARISRNHAQLRLVRGQYILFDLNSTGGTYVNGLRISQQTLKPGDVISLAGVLLIYGEEAFSPVEDTIQIEMDSPETSHGQ